MAEERYNVDWPKLEKFMLDPVKLETIRRNPRWACSEFARWFLSEFCTRLKA